MPVKSNLALSYIAMLTVVGFFLWVIRNFVRGLRRKAERPPIPPATAPPPEAGKREIEWPVHIYLSRGDDIPVPGRLLSISPAEAFMESSACLKTGQRVSLYIDVPQHEQVHVTAKILWARTARDGRNAAQVAFPDLSAAMKHALYQQALLKP